MKSDETVKSPKFFQKKSIRLLRDGNINEAIAIVKAGVELHPNNPKLIKWLDAIRGRLWVDHVVGRTSEITKEDVEEIAEDIVNEKLGDTFEPILNDNENLEMNQLDLHESGLHIYGIKCTECNKTYYNQEKTTFMEKHTEKTGHTNYLNLGLEYHTSHGGYFTGFGGF